MANNILYVNKYTNTCYNEEQILETNIKSAKDKTTVDTIFELYARLLTRSEEQRLVFYHLTFDKDAYSVSKLIKVLSEKYNKSDRTYRRAIEYLLRRRIIYVKDTILYINMDYNLSVLDLEKVKGIMIHIL